MKRLLLFGLALLPLVELYLLLFLARRIGPAPTFGLVLLSAVVGIALARDEGIRVFRRWREARDMGRVPEEGVLSGLLLFLAAVLLVLPGILTDAAGLALLVPAVRRSISAAARRHFERRVRAGMVRVVTHAPHSPPHRRTEDKNTWIH